MNLEAGLQKLNEVSEKKVSDAEKRLTALFDDGSFTLLDKLVSNGGADCDVVTAYGTVAGITAFAFSQNKGEGGAMGRASARKIEKVYDLAKKVGAPIIGVYNSDGAHIEEGIDALEAYGTLMSASAALSGVIPQISVIAGDCIGSAAMLAALADVVIMVEDASFYVTAGSILGDDKVGTATTAAQNGTAAYIAKSIPEALEKAAEVLTFLPENNLSAPGFADTTAQISELAGSSAIDFINCACDADSFCELYAEYADKAIVGFGRINGATVAIAATNTNGEKLDGAAASKLARFIRFSDAFSIPIVSFVDSVGILGNLEDELSGGVKYATQLAHAYSEATTAKITVITGAAVGSAYIAFASKASGADSVFALPNAYVSALEPKTAVEFLMKDALKEGKSRETLEEEYKSGEASAFSAAEKGYIEDIINPAEMALKLSTALEMLASKRVSTLNKKHSNIQL